MIKILMPDDNLEERKYIINIIFNEFLGLKYQIEFNASVSNWEIHLDNGKQLTILDAFFGQFTEELSYLDLKNITYKVQYLTNQFISEDDIPVIYGDSSISVSENRISCGIDIFASSFFMLTRWEELVNPSRDRLNRFSAKDSLAYQCDFLSRPVVNEYVEMLWNMLTKLGYSGQRKDRSYQLLATHDVDYLQLRNTPIKSIARTIVGDVVKRKNIMLAVTFAWDYLKSLCLPKKDPYNSFDYLMDLSDIAGIKSYFFFMGGGRTVYDNNYTLSNAFIQKLVEKIKNRGHFIGIHPSFDAYNDSEQFLLEKKALEQSFDIHIVFGREHYLRFEVPTTWQIWDDFGMKWDSSMGYHDKEGFRCGVCYPFQVFNVRTRKMLNLIERPLIVMEGTFAQYQQNLSVEKMQENIQKLIDIVKYYNGEFVFLWHNSSFNNREWKKYQSIYEGVLGK